MSSIMNRAMSVRSKQSTHQSSSGQGAGGKHKFSMASLRGATQPEMSKKLFKLIKSEREAIAAYENAAKERASVASQLSDWGEETNDDAVSELSDKLGVLMSELADQEDQFAQNLEDSRAVLKLIRNTEKSVAPSRDHKAKVSDDIQKLKYKEPQSPKIAELEQELVRAEAQSLVAEAQLTNITRQKFKESYDLHLAATIERAEKQILLAKQGRRLLNLLDDTPVVPGDVHPTFEGFEEARLILAEAEDEMREWSPSHEPITSNSTALGTNAMPSHQLAESQPTAASSVAQEGSVAGTTTSSVEPGPYTEPVPSQTYAA